jgi:hypothetical protein
VSQDIVTAGLAEKAMDNWAVGRLIDCAAGKDGKEKTKATLKQDLCEVAAELAGPNPSPVERTLAEAAATSWFAFRMHESHFAGCSTEGGLSLAQSDDAQRRIDWAHRRYLSTLTTLAAVRRLAVPALQINVAQRQQIAQLDGGGSS